MWYTNTTYINTKSIKSTDHHVTTKQKGFFYHYYYFFFFTTHGPLFFPLKVRVKVFCTEDSQCFLKFTEQFPHFHTGSVLNTAQMSGCPPLTLATNQKRQADVLVNSVLIVEWFAGVVDRKTHLSEDGARSEEAGLNWIFIPARGFPAAEAAEAAVHAGTECLKGFSSDGLPTQLPSFRVH